MKFQLSRLLIVLSLSVTVGASACSKQSAEKETTGSAQQSASSQHAAASVKPGSHDDWCGEHAVPESQCTRCNTELIAAFKATGDWCEEHGLPESQCLKCNPELKIVRPAKEK